jgi:hypothetical protein
MELDPKFRPKSFIAQHHRELPHGRSQPLPVLNVPGTDGPSLFSGPEAFVSSAAVISSGSA